MQQYLQLLHAVRVHTPNVWPPAPIPNFEHWLPCERLPNKNTSKQCLVNIQAAHSQMSTSVDREEGEGVLKR